MAGAGTALELSLEFFNEESGVLTDPDTVELHITYGDVYGLTADFAGPFPYEGASSPVPGQVWREGTGEFEFGWQIPSSAPAGAYVANWLCGLGSDTFLVTETFFVEGGFIPPVPSGDVGYWTGGIDYVPSPGNLAQLTEVSIPFGAVDGNGITWLFNKLDGWDSPDVQGGGVIAKSGDHGAWPAPQFYAARTPTLTLTASAATQALRDQARAILQQAIPVSDLAMLTLNEPVPKQALVRRSGRIQETYPTLTDVQFTVGLVQPDPRKYGTQLKTPTVPAAMASGIGFMFPLTFPLTPPAQPPGGSLVATNDGLFETRPVITVQGPITAPALTNVTTGQRVSWSNLVLGPGDQLVADFNVAQARLNGVFRSADLASSWWTLPPEVGCTVQLTGVAGAGASMQVAFRDSWI